MSLQIAVGFLLSRTVILVEQESMLPLTSVTYIVTDAVPTSLQSNTYLFNVIVAIPQLSVLPLLTSLLSIVAVPLDPNCTEGALQIALGLTVSIIVIVA